MVAMETEFKIPAHPVPESLFSKHTMTSLLSPARMAEMSSRLHIRSLEGGLSHSPKAARAAEGSPVRMRSPKEKHLVRKSPKKSPIKVTDPTEGQHSAKTNGEASSTSVSSTFLQPRTAAVTNEEEAKTYEKPFYFESDHVALKNNADYQNILKTVCMLEAQRMKSIEDLDKLLKGQEEALKNPIAFVHKLQNKEDLKLPKAQTVTEVPSVHWDQYTGSMAFDQKHRHRTRFIATDSPAASSSSSFPSTSKGCIDGDKNKTGNFNKPWSIDEQKRLEQLLVEFPPEEVEARRWEKIARSLNNRTMLQVASRVQKYFIKLAKAGLPIPGRMPNLQAYGRKGNLHRHQRFRHFQMNPYSTFLSSYEPPVHMADNDDDFSDMCEMSRTDLPMAPGMKQEEEEVSDDESIPMELRNTEEYKQILSLKAMRSRRLREEKGLLTRHIGYKCDSCNCDPIIGPRWHCKECPDEISVDFCSDCIDMNYENDLHKRDHKMECIKSVLPHIDRDYTKFTSSGYNYLDPNYMPAS